MEQKSPAPWRCTGLDQSLVPPGGFENSPRGEIGDAGVDGPNWPSATWPARDRPSARRAPACASLLPAWSEPVGQATRAQAGERQLSRRQEDAIDGEHRTTALGDPAREAPPGDHGGAMATTGSHRAKPFGGRGRRERRQTKRDPGERCQGAAARATCGRLLRNNPESLPFDNSDWK